MIDATLSKYEIFTLITQVTIAIAAIIFGYFQWRINSRLVKLQDYVAVSVIPGPNASIKLLNVGKTNLYLHRFDIPNNSKQFDKPRFISAGTGNESYYWLPAPKGLKPGDSFDMKLYLSDQFGKKWVFEGGGEVDPLLDQEGKLINNGFFMRVWSYRTYPKKWEF